ncbi:MAG: LuxR C-terminal-related transcriptional regulator [Ilumatobacteraceae bacterium]
MAVADRLHISRGDDWQALVAVGLIAGDLSPIAIARYAGVHPSHAEAALTSAREAGIINPDGSVDEIVTLRLVADLPTEEAARVNASVARHLIAGGPERLLDAVAHARAAGSLVDPDEIVAMADHGGRMSLLLGDYASAFELLKLGDELDMSKDAVAQGLRLCDLALAADGLGRVIDGRQYLARAVSLGELTGDAHLVARGAVQYALPTDWYAGDPRAARLLQRASEFDLDDDNRVAVMSARSLVEMRIPLTVEEGHQLAWITRPAVAQGLADQALTESEICSPEVRALALLSWRATHRAPHYLTQRRNISSEALNLSQQLRHSSYQVESAVAVAVDALESGDRPLADQAMAVARWVGERDGNPRLKWRAYCLAVGTSLLDGDSDAALEFRCKAREIGQQINHPGWFGADMLFLAQDLLLRDDVVEMRKYMFDESFPGLANPIGRSCVAHMFARNGDLKTAERHIRRAFRQLDEEASYLLLATRMTDTALLIGVPDLLKDLAGILAPWVDHVAVDSNGWWCDGPVSGWLALINLVLERHGAAKDLSEQAEVTARALNDQRTLARLRWLRSHFEPTSTAGPAGALTAREQQVLELLATGATNAAIARTLAYSVSTIRDETTEIYRKLQVKGRAEAVGRAIQLGLITKTL